MPGPAGACMVAVRERKRASKNAKRGGASRALAALGRSARQPFTAEAHARLRAAIIAVQTDWTDTHGRVSKAALCEADEDAVEDAQKACSARAALHIRSRALAPRSSATASVHFV